MIAKAIPAALIALKVFICVLPIITAVAGAWFGRHHPGGAHHHHHKQKGTDPEHRKYKKPKTA